MSFKALPAPVLKAPVTCILLLTILCTHLFGNGSNLLHGPDKKMKGWPLKFLSQIFQERSQISNTGWITYNLICTNFMCMNDNVPVT